MNGNLAEDLALLAERDAPVDGADVLPPAIGGCLVILAGRLDVVRCDDARCIATLGPALVLGGLPALGQEIVLRAAGSAEIARLGAEAIDRLLERDSDRFNAIAEHIANAERVISLAFHLSRLFPGLERDGLDQFGAGVSWVALRGGEVLFEQGDAGDAAYLVISGRLRAAVGDVGGERVLNEIGEGETVGEMALFSDAARSATVYAARDSQLARLSREVFDALTQRHPQALRHITGFVIERLRRQSAGERSVPPPVSLAVVPARPGADLQRLVGRIAAALHRFGSVELVDRAAVERALGRPGIADAGDEDSAGMRLVRWLNERDLAARYVIYQADPEWTRWTERALRQADHVLIVAMTKHGPELGENEQRLAEIWRKTRPPRRSLVLLHTPGKEPRGTAAWLSRRDLERHFHVRGESEEDVARLARLLTGRGVGLVLGGGGARGLAHLGVLRALDEAAIPIDSVGGTSIGSIIGALPAMGFDAEASIEICRRSFSGLFDPTFPVVSLLTGRRIGARVEAVMGELEIEDLPIPYYCVSTNLSVAEEVVHRRGSLFRAVRSSISLPGILPPIAFEGDLYVDGGLTDNLPIDVMAEQCGGSVIAVDVSPEQDLRSEADLIRGFSGWRVLGRRLNPFSSPLDVPLISSVLMRSAVVGSLVRAREQRAAERASLYLRLPVDEWNLLAFDKLDAIVAAGYQASAGPIREWWTARR